MYILIYIYIYKYVYIYMYIHEAYVYFSLQRPGVSYHLHARTHTGRRAYQSACCNISCLVLHTHFYTHACTSPKGSLRGKGSSLKAATSKATALKATAPKAAPQAQSKTTASKSPIPSPILLAL